MRRLPLEPSAMTKLRELNEGARRVWRIAMLVQTTEGISRGLAIFIWGPLFYEKLAAASNPQMGMTMTASLIVMLNVLCLFLEVPTGAIGDALGRKWAVVISFFCRMLNFLLLALVPLLESVSAIVAVGALAYFVFSFYYTFFSGSFTAWCVDSLRECAPDVGYEQILAPANTARLLGALFGGVFSVVMYVESYTSIVFLVGAFMCFAVALYCMGNMPQESSLRYLDLSKLTFAAMLQRMGETISVGSTVLRKSPVILAAIFIYGSFTSVLNLIGYFWPIYLRSSIAVSQQTIYWISFIVIMQSASSVGSHWLTRLSERWHVRKNVRANNTSLRRLLTFTSFFAAVPVLLLSWATLSGYETLWFLVAVLVVVKIAHGIIVPSYETLVNNFIPTTYAGERSTILSLGSLLRSVMIMLLAIPTGGTGGETTTITWAIPAIILLILAVLGNFVIAKAQTKVVNIEMKGG